jgi:hypothetical protein
MIIPRAPSAALIGGACVLAFLAGWTVQGWRGDARQLTSVKNAIEQAAVITAQDDEVATRFEAEKTHIVTVFRTIEERQDQDAAANPDYKLCHLSPAGIVLWNAVNAGRIPATSGESDDTMRAGTPAPHWGFGGYGAEPSGSDEGVSPAVQATDGPASTGQSEEVTH